MAASALDLAIADALLPFYERVSRVNEKTKKKEFVKIPRASRAQARSWIYSTNENFVIFANLCGYDAETAKEKINRVLRFYDAQQKLKENKGIYA